MNDLAILLEKIQDDQRYKDGLSYGVPRKGHPEGRVCVHIEDLKNNLMRLSAMRDGRLITSDEQLRLLILIHVHDIMKYAAISNSPISDPNSHASLARKFLAEFTDDEDLQNIVQAHDENLALWQQQKAKGKYSVERLEDRVINKIKNIDLLLIFQIIDAYTPGKTDMREMPRWFVDQVNKYKPTPRVYKVLELFGI